jgi:hypothetical protein
VRNRRLIAAALSMCVVIGGASALQQPASAAPVSAASLLSAHPSGGSRTAPVQRSGAATVATTAAPPAVTAPANSGQVARPKGAVADEPSTTPTTTSSVKQVTTATTVRPGVRVKSSSRVEIPSLRTTTSSTFLNPDGTRTSEIYQTPQFAPVGPGELEPINETLLPSTAGTVTPNVSSVPVSLQTKASAKGDVASVFTGGGGWVGFGLSGAASATGKVSGSQVSYSNVWPSTDLTLTATSTGLKEAITLKSATAGTHYAFPLSLQSGVTPRLDSKTHGVDLISVSGAVVAQIPAGFMFDSNVDPATGDPASSWGVSYSLAHSHSGWTLNVDLDSAWVKSSARKFPVTVDPTVVTINDSEDDESPSSPSNAIALAPPPRQVSRSRARGVSQGHLRASDCA